MLLTSDITIGEAGVYALLGYAVVFFGIVLLMLILILSIAYLVFGSYNPFLYFRF